MLLESKAPIGVKASASAIDRLIAISGSQSAEGRLLVEASVCPNVIVGHDVRQLVSRTMDLLGDEPTATAAIQLLYLLANMAPRVLSMVADFLDRLMRFLEHGSSEDAKTWCALLLQKLAAWGRRSEPAAWDAATPSVRNSLAAAKAAMGAPAVLGVIIRELGPGQRQKTETLVQILAHLAEPETNRPHIVTAGAVPELIRLLGAVNSPRGRACAAETLYWLGLGSDVRKGNITAAAPVPALVRILQDGSPHGRAFAAGTLRNLASDIGNHKVLLEKGGVGLLVRLLKEGTALAREHASAVLFSLVLYGAAPNIKVRGSA